MTVHDDYTLGGNFDISPKNPNTKKVYHKEDSEILDFSARSYTFFILSIPRSSYPIVGKTVCNSFHDSRVTTQRELNLFPKPIKSAIQVVKPRFSHNKVVV